jgi:hypothetical protein
MLLNRREHVSKTEKAPGENAAQAMKATAFRGGRGTGAPQNRRATPPNTGKPGSPQSKKQTLQPEDLQWNSFRTSAKSTVPENPAALFGKVPFSVSSSAVESKPRDTRKQDNGESHAISAPEIQGRKTRKGRTSIAERQVHPTASSRISGQRIFNRIDSALQPKVPRLRGWWPFSGTSLSP